LVTNKIFTFNKSFNYYLLANYHLSVLGGIEFSFSSVPYINHTKILLIYVFMDFSLQSSYIT